MLYRFVQNSLYLSLCSCISVPMSVCLSVCLSVRPSVRPSVCLSSNCLWLSVCLSVALSVFVFQSVWSMYLYIYLSVCISIYLLLIFHPFQDVQPQFGTRPHPTLTVSHQVPKRKLQLFLWRLCGRFVVPPFLHCWNPRQSKKVLSGIKSKLYGDIKNSWTAWHRLHVQLG